MPIASKNINAEKIQGNLDITSVSASAFTGSFIGDGAGLYNLPTGSLLTTASFNAYTGSATSQFAGTSSFAHSSSNSITASYYAESDPIFTAVSGTFNTTASFESFTSSIQPQVDALIAATSSYVQNAVTSSMLAPYMLTSQTASMLAPYVLASQTASMTVLSSSHAETASYVTTAQTASYITASNVYGTVTSASYALTALSSSYAISSSYAESSSYSTTSSYALTALSSSYASFATSASFALTSTNTSDVLIYVKNVTGAAIAKGTVVRISGATGDNALISTASWDSDGMSANTLGILNETIADQSWGYVMTEGKLLGINTNSFTPGQLLFLGPTGSIIGYEPIPPYHAVRLGQALRIQSINGSMYVRIDNGYELNELHNVLIISGSDGDLLVASGSNGNGKKLYINSKQLTGSYAITGSLTATNINASAVTASALYAGSTYISGSLTVLGGATIFGSSSFQYVTSSQIAVSASFISVNVFEPVERFGGLKIYDSGSSNATASFAWDSLHNHFVYQNVSGSSYSGGMFLSGPRNSGSLGDEPTLTNWFVPRSDGGDHLENSQIYSSGSTHIVTGSLQVTAGVTASFHGTASWANNSITASYIQTAQTASYVLNAISASFATTAVSASYIDGGFY